MKLKDIALAAALAIASSGALADDQNPPPVQLMPSGAGMFAASFGATHGLNEEIFVDSFVFSLPAGFGNPLGNGMVSFDSLSGPITLVVGLLASANGDAIASTDGLEMFPGSLAFTNAMAPITLTVLGFTGEGPGTPSYAGRLTFNTVAAIPEPETYALMLAGLAGVGYVARRRKEKAGALAAA